MINSIFKLITFVSLSFLFISCGGGGGGGGSSPAPVNNAPTLSSINNVTTQQGTVQNVTLNATDANNDTLTYSTTSSNSSVTLSISNNILTINPNSFVGDATITVTVKDSKNATDSKSFTLTVNPTYTINGTVVDGYIENATVCFDANNNGTCDSGEKTTTTDENGKYTFTNLTSTNPQMNFIAFGGTDTATNTPFESTIKRVVNTNESSTGTIFITPLTDIVSSEFIKNSTKNSVVLETLENNISKNLGIENDINADPTKNSDLFKKTQEIEITKKLIRAISEKEDEILLSNSLSNEINSTPSTTVLSISNILEDFDSTVEEDKITFVENQLNTIVEDLKNSNSSTTENIQKELEDQIKSVKTKIDNNEYKNPTNNAPTLLTISNTTTQKGVSKNITLNANDVDGDVLTYSATSSNSSVTLSISNNILTINPNSFIGTATINVTVRDSKNATDSKSFTLTVNQVNTAPTLEVINDIFIQKGTIQNITLNGYDIDGDVLTYSVTSSRSDIIATISGNTLNISTSPTMSSGTKTGTITVTVKDSKNASASRTFNISAVSYYVEPYLEGKVIDGYIKNADICLDLNINGICDSGEIQTTTNDNGEFKLNYEFKSLDSNSRIINIIASGGVDINTNKSFPSTIKRVINLDKLLKNSIINITPISDLIASDFLKNPLNTASYLSGLETTTIPTKISIDSTKVYADPTLDYTLFVKTQEIESIKKFIRNIYQVDEKALSTAILDVILAKNSTTPLSISAVLTKLNKSVDNTKLTFMEQQFTILREQINSINSNSLLNASEKIIDKQISFILNKITNSQFKKINNFITSIDINSSNLLSNIAINEDEILLVDVLNADSFTITSSNLNIVISKDGDMVILTPNENWNGTSTITVGTKSFILTVNPVNDAPNVSNISNLVMQKNTAEYITLSAEDPENNPITYSATSNTPQLTLSVVGDRLTFTPANLWTGTATITVVANDGSLNSSAKTFTVDVVSYYTKNYLNGKAIDGYIKNADVCLDLNINGICDNGEIQTTTNNNGEFKIDYDFKTLSSTNRLINIIVSNGIDTSTNKDFPSIIKRVANLNTITPNDITNVTPISDLVASAFIQSSTKTETKLTQLESDISTKFPITLSKIYSDPISDYSLFAKIQEIENIKRFIRTIYQVDENTLSNAISTTILAKDSSTFLNISNILTELNANISNDKLTFVESQLIFLREQLNTITSNNSLDISQKAIDEQISFILNKVSNNLFQKINNYVTPIRLDSNSLPSLGDISINEDEIAVISVESSNLFNFSSSNNNISIIQSGNILVLTPNENWNGTSTITVGTKSFILTVNPVNDAPNVNSPNKLTMQRNTTQFTTLIGTDVENDILTFKAQSNTDKVAINIVGNKINFTANSSWIGVATITIFANDGFLDSSSKTFDVEVVSHYDSDNDLISDDIEELIGTNKNIADENTNGILDGIESGTPKSDTFFDKLWHIRNVGQTGVYPAQPNLTATNGNDLGITKVQGKYMGYNGGNPLIVAVVDGTIDFNHEDLVGSKENSLSVDFGINSSASTHGTQVAGILGARAFNGKGVRGIAPYIKIAGINLTDYTSTTASDFSEKLKTAWLDSDSDGKIAIVNNSWSKFSGLDNDVTFYDEYMKIASETKRVVEGEAKGKLFVCAAGNNRWSSDGSVLLRGTEFSGMLNNPYVITVAAANDNNIYSTYSNPGSNIWVTAYGGKDTGFSNTITGNERAIGITTTYKSNLKTDDGYRYGTDTNYDAGMSGTSAATPMVSGVLALTLEACPNLNWRDVKHLLAKYATKIDSSNTTWVTNSAGYHHSTDYGFGLVNVEAMINDCTNETTSPLPTTIKDIKESKNITAISIPTDGINMLEETIDFTSDVTIESIGLSLQINGAVDKGKEFQINLISPSGTKINMVKGNSNVSFQWIESRWVYAAGFFGENAQGTWKVQIKNVGGGTPHQLTKVNLRAFGH